MVNESILGRFRLGGIDASIRCRSEGDCEESESGDVENEDATDSGGSEDGSVFTGHS